MAATKSFRISSPTTKDLYDKFDLYNLTIKYDFDSFQVVSATADWDREQNQTQDISEAIQDYIGGFFGPSADFPFSTAAGGLGAGSITEIDYSRQVSEELRVASTGDSAFQWLGGGCDDPLDPSLLENWLCFSNTSPGEDIFPPTMNHSTGSSHEATVCHQRSPGCSYTACGGEAGADPFSQEPCSG